MKLVSLDPKDRTVNQPAVLVEPKQIREHVTKLLHDFGGQSIDELSPEQIMRAFIEDMRSENCGWSKSDPYGRQCLLRVTIEVLT